MIYRRFELRDRMPVYQMFRETIWDYMLQCGMTEPDDGFDLDEFFQQQHKLYVHLEENASEDWVAVDDDHKIVGWARSIERDDHLQLTHFFVSTAIQGGGVGRALLDRAFPLQRCRQRSIIATSNPRALSLYLRYGVNFQGMAFSIYGSPQSRRMDSDLEVEKAIASTQTLDAIVEIDFAILGYRRLPELEFFMNNQPTFLFRRQGQLVAYAFGCGNHSAGPAAALCSEDMPTLLQQIEQSAIEAGVDSLWLTIPAAAEHAVRWALQSGYQIDPFHEFLLAKNSEMKLDRYLMTQSAFVW